jgi:hypothetical protein
MSGNIEPFPWITTVLSQYANSPTIMQLLSNYAAYIDPATNINSFFDLVWNVDTAEGYGLDVWGRIVGVSRVLHIPVAPFFGFSGPVGPSGTPFNVGIFYHGVNVTSNFTLLDGPYRGLILAKALFNICNGTIQAINQIMVDIFGAAGPFPVAGNSYCTDGNDMTMTYTFGDTLTPLQLAIVEQSGVLPRPCGVASSVVQL